jgi:hypothetical protein
LNDLTIEKENKREGGTYEVQTFDIWVDNTVAANYTILI